MGAITFEGEPPYERMVAQSAQASATRDGVDVVVTVALGGPDPSIVPIQILLTPEDALSLAVQLRAIAPTAQSRMADER